MIAKLPGHWSVLRNESANVVEVGGHVRLHVAGRRDGLQMCPAVEADVHDRSNNLGEINRALAEVIRVVFEMELADTVLTEPADLFVDVEARG